MENNINFSEKGLISVIMELAVQIKIEIRGIKYE